MNALYHMGDNFLDTHLFIRLRLMTGITTLRAKNNNPAFDGFERKNGFFPLCCVCITQYDETMPNVW